MVRTSLMQRLLRQHPTENAVIELNNLLATKPIKDISYQDILAIEHRYQVNLSVEFKLNLEEFYAVYLNYCIADGTLNRNESEELEYLKQLLSLNTTTTDKLSSMLGEPIYRQAYQQAISNGRLRPEQLHALNKMSQLLKLPPALAEQISSELKMNYIKNYVEKIVADERYTPAEEEELQHIARSFNVTIPLNEKTKARLQKLKIYWALENLDLPVIQPDITLQRSEVCHLRIPHVNWYELRSERRRVNYSGYSTRIRIAKGFYLRSGSSIRSCYNAEVMKMIDNGTLYLTSKRIVFTGSRKNSYIQLSKIIDFTPYSDGVKIGKGAGKSPTLKISHQVDVFCMILERLLNER